MKSLALGNEDPSSHAGFWLPTPLVLDIVCCLWGNPVPKSREKQTKLKQQIYREGKVEKQFLCSEKTGFLPSTSMGVLGIPVVGDLGSLTCFRCLFTKGVQVGVEGKLSEAPMATAWERRNPAKQQPILQSKEKGNETQLKPLLQQPRPSSTSERRRGHKSL